MKRSVVHADRRETLTRGRLGTSADLQHHCTRLHTILLAQLIERHVQLAVTHCDQNCGRTLDRGRPRGERRQPVLFNEAGTIDQRVRDSSRAQGGGKCATCPPRPDKDNRLD